MTPEICLISVPHSGTMFTREIFVSHGWYEQGLNGLPRHAPTLYQGHCEKVSQTYAAMDLGYRMPIVMPLRHPYRVEESWRRRRKDPLGMLDAYWHMLDCLHPHVALFVPLDAGEGMRRVMELRLSILAGKDLKIDWDTVVNGEKNTHTVALSSLDPSDSVREIRSHSLFTEFYGDTDDGPDDVRRDPCAEQQVEPDTHTVRR